MSVSAHICILVVCICVYRCVHYVEHKTMEEDGGCTVCECLCNREDLYEHNLDNNIDQKRTET